jgi:outer membrane protein W
MYSQSWDIELNTMPGVHRTLFDPIFPKYNFQNNGGIFVTKFFSDKWGLSTGLNTRILKSERTYDTYYHGYYDHTDTSLTKLSYLELPLNCIYKWKGFYFRGGINLNYLTGYLEQLNNEIKSEEKPIGMNFLLGLNINIGYQIQLTERWYINAAIFYDYPILFSNPFRSPLMNYGLMVGFGYHIQSK